ncbi:MAG: hypothetical protein L0211_03950 [Planctomycetaceae bacterium]|nr:hypothetical protein [Planctomycetaceae bacterium]
MSIAQDLLDQASHLVSLESNRPKQASLRRAISSAYYALFHLLVEEASASFAADRELRLLVARAFEHGEMKKAAKSFAAGNLPKYISAVTGSRVPKDLQIVARAFVDLQEARHEADYNFRQRFTRTEVQDHISVANNAFTAWNRVRKQLIAQAFLAALLLFSRWNKRADA